MQTYREEERPIEKQEEEKREAEWKAQLEEARLQNSISQLQPHFLYNTLSSIRELVLEDPKTAADLLYELTVYLRSSLWAMTHRQMIPLREELETIRTYVKIETMRFGEDHLKFVYEIEEEDFSVPPLSIQPLVENAIRHGISRKRGKSGTVRIHSYRAGEEYRITVEDDGIGFDVEAYQKEMAEGMRDSTGISNLKFRIEACMKGKIEIESRPGEGTRVIMRIPAEKE